METQPDEFVKDLVSVIIPTYNRYELLNHSIRSVLSNTYKNVEIIVVNDCSTDQRYYSGELEKYEKTTIIHLPVNMRVKHNVSSAQGMTRNYGIEKARGEWIAFLDDDDFYVENKIEIQLEAMKKNNMLFSTTKMYLIDHKTLSMDKLDFTVVCLNNDIDKENKIITLDMIHKQNHVSNSTVIIHHSIVKKTGLQNIIPHGEEDWDYWKRAIQYTQCLFLAIPLIYYTLRVGGYRKPTHYH